MKFCNICQSYKDFSEFNKNRKKKDGLQTRCRCCQREQNNVGYRENPNRRNSIKDKRDSLRGFNYSLLRRYKRFCGCRLCGEREPVALDLHHLESDTKENSVSRLVIGSTKRLKTEIRKCVVLCANCHRKLHAGILEL